MSKKSWASLLHKFSLNLTNLISMQKVINAVSVILFIIQCKTILIFLLHIYFCSSADQLVYLTTFGGFCYGVIFCYIYRVVTGPGDRGL